MKGKKNQFVVEEKKMNEWNQFLPRSRQRSMIRESQEIEMLIRYVAGKRNWHRLTKTHILLLFIHNLLHTLHKILDYKKKTSETMAELLYFFCYFFFCCCWCVSCVCVCAWNQARTEQEFVYASAPEENIGQYQTVEKGGTKESSRDNILPAKS